MYNGGRRAAALKCRVRKNKVVERYVDELFVYTDDLPSFKCGLGNVWTAG